MVFDAERLAVRSETTPRDFVEPEADDAIARHAEQLLLGAIGELVTAVRPDQDQALAEALDDVGEPPLGALPLGDVHARHDDAVEVASRIAQRGRVHRNHPRPSLRGDDLEHLIAHGRLTAAQPLEGMIVQAER